MKVGIEKNLFDARSTIQASTSVEDIFCYSIPQPK